jgi:hypothetical protein
VAETSCLNLVAEQDVHVQERTRLDRKLVHKANRQHVFVERVEQLPKSPEGYDQFLAPLIIERDHPFFFEHPIDHAPGLMLIEGVRQTGTAVSHLFYEISFDLVFVLNWIEVKFGNFGELNSPIAVKMAITEKSYRHNQLQGLACKSHWIQGGQSIGTMEAKWTFSSPATLARLRRSAKKKEIA